MTNCALSGNVAPHECSRSCASELSNDAGNARENCSLRARDCENEVKYGKLGSRMLTLPGMVKVFHYPSDFSIHLHTRGGEVVKELCLTRDETMQ